MIGCPSTMPVAVCGVVGRANDVRTISFADSCGVKIAVVVMPEEVAVIGCPSTMPVAVCGVVGGANDVRTISFADSCISISVNSWAPLQPVLSPDSHCG